MVVIEPIRLIDSVDSHDVLHNIDTTRRRQRHVILDLSSSTALHVILTQVSIVRFLLRRGTGAEYCDQPVFLCVDVSVCPRAYLWNR